jgi:MerR family transcriptional regulator/heat shock protein HspR
MKRDEAIFPIRTAAKLIGISVHTLRMYEKEGLIIPHKSKGNQRIYSQRDIERVLSIRKSMRELKLSLRSIQVILSMVPCYELINCTDTDRQNCRAYQEYIQPCWKYKHMNNICETINCKECEVYINHFDFKSTNNTIKKYFIKEM